MSRRRGCQLLALWLALNGCSRSGLELGAPPASDDASSATSSSSSTMCVPDGAACSDTQPCCDSECVSGICGAPRCQPADAPVQLAGDLVWPMGLVVDQSYVYFVSYDQDGAVYRAHKDGGTQELLSEEVWPHDITFDDEHLFISTESSIVKMRKDGADRSTLTNTFGGAGLGLLGHDVVWAEYFGMNIKSIAKSGGSPSTLAALPSSPFRLLVHQGEVYFTGIGLTLHRLTGDGSYATVMNHDVRSLTADEAALYVTVNEQSVHQAMRQPLDGSADETLLVGPNFMEGVAVDHSHIYVSTTDQVLVAEKSAPAGLISLHNEPMLPGAIGVDDSCVYVVVRQPGPEQGDGKLIRIPKTLP